MGPDSLNWLIFVLACAHRSHNLSTSDIISILKRGTEVRKTIITSPRSPVPLYSFSIKKMSGGRFIM